MRRMSLLGFWKPLREQGSSPFRPITEPPSAARCTEKSFSTFPRVKWPSSFAASGRPELASSRAGILERGQRMKDRPVNHKDTKDTSAAVVLCVLCNEY